jgi:hypothetical protein
MCPKCMASVQPHNSMPAAAAVVTVACTNITNVTTLERLPVLLCHVNRLCSHIVPLNSFIMFHNKSVHMMAAAQGSPTHARLHRRCTFGVHLTPAHYAAFPS